jgi:hypothetical protein
MNTKHIYKSYISSSQVLVSLLSVYLFILPLGNLFRFSSAERSLGLSSIVFLLISALGFLLFLKRTRHPRSLIYVLFLITYLNLMAVSNFGHYAHIKISLQFLLYFFVAYASFELVRKCPQYLIYLIFSLFIGASLSSMATLLEYFNFIDLSAIRGQSLKAVSYGDFTMNVSNGLFTRRTAMASYFIYPLSLALSFLLFQKQNKIKKHWLLIFFILPLLALASTAGRGGILFGCLGPLFAYGATKPLSLILKIIPISIIFLYIIYYFKDHIDVVNYYFTAYNLASGLSVSESQASSDFNRVIFFQETIKNIPNNVFGYGYGKLYDIPGFGTVDAHNSVTLIIASTGIIGITFILLISIKISYVYFITLFNKENSYIISLKKIFLSVMLSAAFYNQIHIGITNGIFWVFLGISISIFNIEKK